MKIEQLLKELVDYCPVLLQGDDNWEVERLADDDLAYFDENSVYVEDLGFYNNSSIKNSGTVIISEGLLPHLSPIVINVIMVSAADLDSIRRKLSALLW